MGISQVCCLIHRAIRSRTIPFFSSNPCNHSYNNGTDSAKSHGADHDANPCIEPALPLAFLPSSIDDILKNWVGEFGRAQVLHFMLSSFAWTLEALHTLVTIFADKNPSWRCVTNPEHVVTTSASGFLCVTTSPTLSSICSIDRSMWEWVGGKSESTVSEWDLVCDNSYKKGLAQSSFFVGFLIGSGLFGHLSDSRLGRKGSLGLACFCNGAFGMLTAASPNLAVYAILRTLTGISSSGLGLTSFVLGTECIGPTKRTNVSMSSLYFYPFGTILLAGLATMASGLPWRYLYLITSAPSLVYLVFILPFMDESPRWYLVRGRREEAMHVLKGIAKRNGTKLPEGVTLSVELEVVTLEDGNIHTSCRPTKTGDIINRTTPPRVRGENTGCETNVGGEKKAEEVKEECKEANGTLIDVFKRDDTRLKILILIVVWFVSALGYFSLNLNVGNIGTNLSLNLVLNALAETPGYGTTTALANKFGRRLTLIIAMLMCATSCLVSGGVSFWLSKYATSLSSHNGALSSMGHEIMSIHHHQHALLKANSYVQMAGGLVGLFAIAGTYNLLYIYTSELFPTVVRNAALGLTNQAASIGCIIAPINVLSAHTSASLPFFIIGIASLVGGLMAFKLPETHNQALRETFEEMHPSKFSN